MDQKWKSPAWLAKLIDDHQPATETIVRGWCEEGVIPSDLAKRNPGKDRAKWFIKVAGLERILRESLRMTDSETREILAKLEGSKKRPITFQRSLVA